MQEQHAQQLLHFLRNRRPCTRVGMHVIAGALQAAGGSALPWVLRCWEVLTY